MSAYCRNVPCVDGSSFLVTLARRCQQCRPQCSDDDRDHGRTGRSRSVDLICRQARWRKTRSRGGERSCRILPMWLILVEPASGDPRAGQHASVGCWAEDVRSRISTYTRSSTQEDLFERSLVRIGSYPVTKRLRRGH